MNLLSLTDALNTTQEFVATTNGIVHVDTILHPLFIQALYPKHTAQIEFYIELLYQIWLDPSPENIVFLPDFMQDKFVHLPNFEEVVALVYPEDHYEKIAFLDFMSKEDRPWSTIITSFSEDVKTAQRQKLLEQGVRIVAIEDAVDHEGPHIIVLTYRQKLPAYNGEVRMIMIEEKKNIVQQPEIQHKKSFTVVFPAVLTIQSIKSLFNDLELFYERYILKLRPPYRPTHHISTKALKEFLLLGKPIQTKTVFDQYQITTMKEGFEKFKSTLPKDVIWNKEVLYDVPDTKQTLHGTIDLIWNDGLYQLTRKTPPSRSALLNGIDPELPLLAAAYCNTPKTITHVGYIQIKGQEEDVITITRYNDPGVLASENIKKLEHILSCNHPRSQEESS